MSSHKQQTIFDANIGRTYYAGPAYFACDDYDFSYSPGYVISNEDIHTITGIIEKPLNNVLTVAASGDQPMFYALRGAKNIDTFDMTACACAIMDIKTTAIHKLKHEEYAELLENLSTSVQPALTVEQATPKIISDMPSRSAEFLSGMRNCGMFTRGFGPQMYTYNMPTTEEYNKMRKKIKRPFNFIWSDITNLHTHLTKQYDMINVSNIFEWLYPEQMHPTLNKLRPHINIGGYIQATIMRKDNRVINTFRHAAKQHGNWATVQTLELHPYNILLLQRVR